MLPSCQESPSQPGLCTFSLHSYHHAAKGSPLSWWSLHLTNTVNMGFQEKCSSTPGMVSIKCPYIFKSAMT